MLSEAFADRPDIQEAVARTVAFLAERSLDNLARKEALARVAMDLGEAPQ